jgi:hypothetical protein
MKESNGIYLGHILNQQRDVIQDHQPGIVRIWKTIFKSQPSIHCHVIIRTDDIISLINLFLVGSRAGNARNNASNRAFDAASGVVSVLL